MHDFDIKLATIFHVFVNEVFINKLVHDKNNLQHYCYNLCSHCTYNINFHYINIRLIYYIYGLRTMISTDTNFIQTPILPSQSGFVLYFEFSNELYRGYLNSGLIWHAGFVKSAMFLQILLVFSELNSLYLLWNTL